VSLAEFHGPDHFRVADRGYRLLPFQFMDLDGRTLVVNEAGEHALIDRPTLERLVGHRLVRDDREYDNLKSKHFFTDSDSRTPVDLLATKVRTKRAFLAGFTRLHIFVVTLRCDHSCHYCQVSRVSVDRSKYDMSEASAMRAVDMVFRSPSPYLKIEFQGGEPLLNFDLIRQVVLAARQRNETERRDLRFVVTTNLSFLSDDMLGFFQDQEVTISTSLDGPAFIHNANRPRPGNDAYDLAIAGIERAREALGHHAVAALMTTTRLSLDHPIEIVDEFMARGFDHIFLRPLSPYGFATKTQAKTGYAVHQFVEFYKRALDRVIALNRGGYGLIELYAQIVLTKILTPFTTGYVDLRSPSGVGIGVAVYNYDGDVYASDEARMLAQMGDTRFRLGSLQTDSYEHIFGGARLRELTAASCVESLPGCSDCAVNAYCGSDPVENYATQGDIIGHRPTSRFCSRNMEIIKHLLRLYHSGDAFIEELFWSWTQNAPVAELLPALPE